MSVSQFLKKEKWSEAKEKEVERSVEIVLDESPAPFDKPIAENRYLVHKLLNNPKIESLGWEDYTFVRSMSDPLDMVLLSPFVKYPQFLFELFNEVSPKLIVKKDKQLTVRPIVETDIQILSYLDFRYNEMIWKYDFLRQFLEQDKKMTFLSFAIHPLHILQAFYMFRLQYSKSKNKKLTDNYVGFETDMMDKSEIQGYYFDKELFLYKISEQKSYTITTNIDENYRDIRNPAVTQDIIKESPDSDLIVCEYGLENPERKCPGKWSMHLKKYYLNSLALSSVLLMLKKQKKGGIGIMKVYHLNDVIQKLFYLLNVAYDETHIFHPQYSRVTEHWIICSGYHPEVLEHTIPYLEKLQAEWYQPGKHVKLLEKSICLPVVDIFPDLKIPVKFRGDIESYFEKFMSSVAIPFATQFRRYGNLFIDYKDDDNILRYLLLSSFQSHIQVAERYIKRNHLQKSKLYNRELYDIISHYLRNVLQKKINHKTQLDIEEGLKKQIDLPKI
jgi:hypothetical protein